LQELKLLSKSLLRELFRFSAVGYKSHAVKHLQFI